MNTIIIKTEDRNGNTRFTACLIVMVAACVILGAAALSSAESRNSLKERLTTLRNWELMEEFDLSQEKANKVFSILDRFDDQRVELLAERRKIMKQLRKSVQDKDISSDTLDELMDKLAKINVQLAELPEKERKALSSQFSPVEQARYLLFSENFARNLRKIMKNDRNSDGRSMRSGGRPRHF